MSAVSGSETERALVTPEARPPLAVPRRLLRMRSDAALAERFALGDESAFDVIYERHRPVVLAVCMGVLGTPPDAEDATQETFSALAVALRSRPPAELRPWLIRVARNASIDTTRRRRHRLLTLDGEIPEVAARPAGGGQAELAVVLDGIRELPEGQRMALLMRELGGHSYTEIAEFLATDEEAVKGLIARARVGLRTYREATELSCSIARSTIAAEPDGRRYDKTIRRHLRGCASCRGYRDALRDDAKALRAALPIQAGTVATGSLSSGMLGAAKGSLLGYGLTQAATTCAASACAVGAIGGMVFVAPVHKLGLPPILPAKTSTVHSHVAAKAPARHVLTPVKHPVATSRSTQPAELTPSTATGRRTASDVLVPRRSHHVKVTRVPLPTLPKHHHRHASAPTSRQGTPTAAGTTSVTTQTIQSTPPAATPGPQSTVPPTQSTVAPTQGAAQPTQSAAQPTQSALAPAQSAATQSSQAGPSQTSQTGSGQGSQGSSASSSGWAGTGGSGNPLHSTGTTSRGSAAVTDPTPGETTTSPTITTATTTPGTTTAPTSSTPTTTAPATIPPTSTTATTTTSPTTTTPGYGWGNVHDGNGGQPGTHHPGGSHQAGAPQVQSAPQSAGAQSATTTTQPTTTPVATTTTTTTTTATTTTTTTAAPTGSSSGWSSHGWSSYGWSTGTPRGHGWGH